ncbi:MAG: peptide chain release factor N(5)-glutamine methyltransferase [Acidobacteria bacterium]|nr:peptide chain release factor N(5)-glutamine methyltransferase [Acidobacteriota bacterium]
MVSSVISLHSLTTAAAARLRDAGIPPEEAELDAQLLAAHVLGWDRTRLIASWRDAAPAGFPGPFARLVGRRERREPISLLLGRREFWGLEFEVTRHVLTPRPETEGIIEAVLTHARDAAVVEDVGTGSGCIAIAIAKELPSARFIASDISERALRVARRNAARHGVANRIAFVHADSSAAMHDVDLIVSNPPYIPDGDRKSLPPEVRDYEPPEALFAGPDGLDAIRQLVARVKPGVCLIFECGAGQERAIRGIIAAAPGLHLVEIRPDLAGIPRIVVLRGQI